MNLVGSSSGGGGGSLGPFTLLGRDISDTILPLAAITLVGVQSLSQLTGQPLANIIFPFGKRKKRSVLFRIDEGVPEAGAIISQELKVLENFWQHQSAIDRKDQTDRILANHVSCSGIEEPYLEDASHSNDNNRCLEYMACLYANEHSTLSKSERDVVAV